MSPNNSQRENINQLQVDVGIIKSQMVEMKAITQAMSTKMDSFAFVKQIDFEEFKKEIRETYATKEEFKPIKTLFWAIITSSAVAVIGVLVGRYAK